jgi:glucose 1-dehydrogenase
MISDKLNLSDKTAFITGSSQGIGKAIALAFAENGATVILQYRKSKKEALEVAK